MYFIKINNPRDLLQINYVEFLRLEQQLGVKYAQINQKRTSKRTIKN